MTAIDKVIQVAGAEVGYLEKRNNNNLYDKTANAGSNNYTKYWQDIKPSYQGQPWCACFVTWCFVKAFGEDMAWKLLKHYPYVYCPTMAGLFTLHANPERGDIVIFKHGGEFTHTGIVTGVDGDYFTTIEGNTSGGSTIIANGGAVCRKGYYNSNLPGTKFCRPEYSLVETITEYTDINDIVWELGHKGILSDNDLWVKYCGKDSNIYWFCRKLCQYVRTKPTGETADREYTDVGDIIWDLNYRGIISDTALWTDYMKRDTNVYWLLRKGLHYCRTH